MSDIVKDLRSECYPEQYSGWASLCSDAADEIERLKAGLWKIYSNPCLNPEGNAEIAWKALGLDSDDA